MAPPAPASSLRSESTSGSSRNKGLVNKNPTLGVATPKKERGSRTALRLDEYTKLLSLAGANPRDYAILQVFLQTGIRVSELCALTRARHRL